MDRHQFLSESLATAGGALLPDHGFRPETGRFSEQVSGGVPLARIGSARFPDGFLWGMATASAEPVDDNNA